jgi:hypothetical protein
LLVADRVGVACTDIVVLADVVQLAVVTIDTETVTMPAPLGVKVAGFAVFEVRPPEDTAQPTVLTLLPATLAVSVKLLVDMLQMVFCEGVIVAVVGLTDTTVALVITLLLHTPEVMVAVTLKVPELSDVADASTGF